MEQQQYTIEYLVNDTGGAIGPRFTSLVPGLTATDLQSMYSIAEPSRTSRIYGRLTINNINMLQAGEYKCNLTNIYGSEKRTTRVAVQRETTQFLSCIAVYFCVFSVSFCH